MVSRSLKQDVWASMMTELGKSCPSGSFELDAAAESYALSKLRAITETHRAELSRSAAKILSGLCRDVHLRVHYPPSPRLGADGVRYHMGHWIPGAFLAGTTWSPKADTLPGRFVELGARLQAYAEAAPKDRGKAEVRLLAQAAQVRRQFASR